MAISSILLLLCACLWRLAESANSTTLVAPSGLQYFVPHIEVANISGLPSSKASSSKLTPLAIINSTNSSVSIDFVKSQLSQFAEKDDVYSDYFSSTIYVQGAACSNSSINGTTNGTYLQCSDYPISAPLKPGPYFMTSQGSIYKAYRLYEDPQSAFTAGLIPTSNDTFEAISVASFSGQAEAAVPVPSRLYFEASPEKPLAGVRVAVKDIYHIKGVKTGAASRDFYKLYPKRNASAPAVQKLIELGAVIVGKVKTSQFANGENPTADWIEVLAPFNPRGDGWQYCSSSSAGSAVAVASYDWLDSAIGTDTSGSMRFPAAYNGVFAGRQSHGGITTNGVVPVSTSLDTLGVFTRSAVDHMKFVKSWYGPTTYKNYTAFPKKIYRITNATIGGFPAPVSDAEALYESFIDKLAKFMKANVTDLQPAAAWTKSGPVPDQDLLVYTNMTYLAVAWYEQVQLLQKPFFADWKAFVGSNQTPKLGPKARASFDYGNNNVTEQRYNESLAIKANFTTWWSTKINPASNETCSEAIYVYPTGAKGGPTYRDTYLSPPNVVVNWQVSHAAVYGGLPDYAVPIGQVKYLSKLTGVNETLPVSISIGAARGCDWMLANLLAELEKAGVTSPVKTGQVAF